MAYRIYLSRRDLDALKLLWKWKVLSTMALSQAIFPNIEVESAYRRLCLLREGGVVTTVRPDKMDGDLWTLTRKGFLAIRDELGILVQEGFRSEHIRHDLYTSAFQLGPFFCQRPPGLTIISEQELRRFDKRDYHLAIPKSTGHRSDGYWIFSNGVKHHVVSIEVELNVKSRTKYDVVADFYRHSPQINEVFWLVGIQSGIATIAEAMQETTNPKGARHSFIDLRDFEASGIHAQFNCGFRVGKTLSNVLPTMASPCRHHADFRLMLETTICPHKSKGYCTKHFKQKTQLTRAYSPIQPHGENPS